MSLTTTLSTALGALTSSEGALQITNNNIANANTPGYSREVVDLSSSAPSGSDNLGNGVVLQGYTSVLSEVLLRQIQQQTQQQSAANAQLGTMQQVQSVFTTSKQDIGTEMSALFSSLSSLSTDPSNISSRQAVLTAGQNLATAFHTASSTLTSQQSSLNTQVTQDVSQINQITQQIAALNPQIDSLQKSGQDAGVLQDQQGQLIQQLSQLTDVQTTQTNDGVTLTTGNGTALVVGNQSYALQTTTDSNGTTQVVDSNGTTITSSLQGGDLGGTIQTRDQTIPGLLNQLDSLANQLGSAFNQAQASGFDLNGNTGSSFFSVPATVSGSAAGISVALTSASQVAASSDSSSGGAGNLTAFSAIQNTDLPSGSTPTDTYANLVYQVGSITANATAESTATTASLQQLNSQLSSVSGVSIDEETTNLIKYQQSYQAAAQVINTVNSLFATTINMMTIS
jgi:flagellar hook-associated protein 1 FlgK